MNERMRAREAERKGRVDEGVSALVLREGGEKCEGLMRGSEKAAAAYTKKPSGREGSERGDQVKRVAGGGGGGGRRWWEN